MNMNVNTVLPDSVSIAECRNFKILIPILAIAYGINISINQSSSVLLALINETMEGPQFHMTLKLESYQLVFGVLGVIVQLPAFFTFT